MASRADPARERATNGTGRPPPDFYYRLWGAVLEVPALRARREDIPLLVEHFRVRCNREDELAVDGFTRQALAVRRRGVVQSEDVRLPSLRRTPAAAAGVEVSGTVAALSRYEAAALQLAGAGGGVRRGELMAHCGISREAARRTLASLVGRRRLRRLGSGRGAWYARQTPDGTVDEPDEHAFLIAARRGGSLPAAPMATRGPR